MNKRKRRTQRVLVVGSDRELTDDASKKRFSQAAHQLGAELAKRGFYVLVGSDSPTTFDFHAVKGMVAASIHEICLERQIIVYRASDDRRPFGGECFKEQRKLFRIRQFSTP